MTISDIITTTNVYIGDSSTDRLSSTDRYQAITEATSWLLEELGNEHMVDRAEIEYLPTVTWYKMNSLTPYLLTAGQLRFKNEQPDSIDFTRVDARDIATMPDNRHAYAIEQYNGHSYLGINIPDSLNSSQDEGCHTNLISLSASDEYTYTGVNAVNILKETNAIRFDMDAIGLTSTGLTTTSASVNLANYEGTGIFVFEIEIPDIDDVTSVSLKFGTNLSTAYRLGVVTQDVNGNPLVAGVNTIKIAWADFTDIGTPDLTAITEWQWAVNHTTTKPVVEGFKLSDLRIAKPIFLTFKYIFYRVGKNATGTDITEFTADTDVPFFSDRYPQYKFAVAHKAAGILFRSLQLEPNSRAESAEATRALDRYRKNFSGERDMGSSNFKVAGISFRGRKIYKRR